MEQTAKQKRIEKIKKRLQSLCEAEHKIKLRCLQLKKIQEVHKFTKDVVLPADAEDELLLLQTEVKKSIQDYRLQMKKNITLLDSLVIYKGGKKSQDLTEICQTILYQRYVLGNKWEAIAKTMGYTPRYLYRLHNLALESLADKRTKRKVKEHNAKKE